MPGLYLNSETVTPSEPLADVEQMSKTWLEILEHVHVQVESCAIDGVADVGCLRTGVA